MKQKPVRKASPIAGVPSFPATLVNGEPCHAESPGSPAAFGDLRIAVTEHSELPPPPSATSQPAAVPPGLEWLAKASNLPPLEQLALCSPKFAETLKSEKAIEAIESSAGLFAGFGIDLGVPLPDWVKAASERGIQGLGCDFLSEVKNAEPVALGTLVELAGLFPKDEHPTSPEAAFHQVVHYIKTESGHLPRDEFKSFAAGRSAAPKKFEKLKSPTERTIAFLVIAVAWREVEKLGSRTKTYKWLKEQKIISPYTEWDEVKNWLKEINLPKGKAGAPRKIGGAAKAKIPVFSKTPDSGL